MVSRETEGQRLGEPANEVEPWTIRIGDGFDYGPETLDEPLKAVSPRTGKELQSTYTVGEIYPGYNPYRQVSLEDRVLTPEEFRQGKRLNTPLGPPRSFALTERAHAQVLEVIDYIDEFAPKLASALSNSPHLLFTVPEISATIDASFMKMSEYNAGMAVAPIVSMMLDENRTLFKASSIVQTLEATPVTAQFWSEWGDWFDPNTQDIVATLLASVDVDSYGMLGAGAGKRDRVAALAMRYLRENHNEMSRDPDLVSNFLVWLWQEVKRQEDSTALEDTGLGKFGRVVGTPYYWAQEKVSEWWGNTVAPEDVAWRKALSPGQTLAISMGADPSESGWTWKSGIIDFFGVFVIDPVNIAAGMGFGMKTARSYPLMEKAASEWRLWRAAKSLVPLAGRKTTANLPVGTRSGWQRLGYHLVAKDAENIVKNSKNQRYIKLIADHVRRDPTGANVNELLERVPELRPLINEGGTVSGALGQIWFDDPVKVQEGFVNLLQANSQRKVLTAVELKRTVETMKEKLHNTRKEAAAKGAIGLEDLDDIDVDHAQGVFIGSTPHEGSGFTMVRQAQSGENPEAVVLWTEGDRNTLVFSSDGNQTWMGDEGFLVAGQTADENVIAYGTTRAYNMHVPTVTVSPQDVVRTDMMGDPGRPAALFIDSLRNRGMGRFNDNLEDLNDVTIDFRLLATRQTEESELLNITLDVDFPFAGGPVTPIHIPQYLAVEVEVVDALPGQLVLRPWQRELPPTDSMDAPFSLADIASARATGIDAKQPRANLEALAAYQTEAIDDALRSIPGVGPKYERELHAAKIRTFQDIVDVGPERLVKLTDGAIPIGRARKIVKTAEEMVEATAKKRRRVGVEVGRVAEAPGAPGVTEPVKKKGFRNTRSEVEEFQARPIEDPDGEIMKSILEKRPRVKDEPLAYGEEIEPRVVDYRWNRRITILIDENGRLPAALNEQLARALADTMETDLADAEKLRWANEIIEASYVSGQDTLNAAAEKNAKVGLPLLVGGMGASYASEFNAMATNTPTANAPGARYLRKTDKVRVAEGGSRPLDDTQAASIIFGRQGYWATPDLEEAGRVNDALGDEWASPTVVVVWENSKQPPRMVPINRYNPEVREILKKQLEFWGWKSTDDVFEGAADAWKRDEVRRIVSENMVWEEKDEELYTKLVEYYKKEAQKKKRNRLNKAEVKELEDEAYNVMSSLVIERIIGEQFDDLDETTMTAQWVRKFREFYGRKPSRTEIQFFQSELGVNLPRLIMEEYQRVAELRLPPTRAGVPGQLAEGVRTTISPDVSTPGPGVQRSTARGGGWYELADGTKVRGRAAAGSKSVVGEAEYSVFAGEDRVFDHFWASDAEYLTDEVLDMLDLDLADDVRMAANFKSQDAMFLAQDLEVVAKMMDDPLVSDLQVMYAMKQAMETAGIEGKKINKTFDIIAEEIGKRFDVVHLEGSDMATHAQRAAAKRRVQAQFKADMEAIQKAHGYGQPRPARPTAVEPGTRRPTRRGPTWWSGGQNGTDTYALEEAYDMGLRTGGQMPGGFETNSGPNPDRAAKFGLTEGAKGYPSRTMKNVDAADITVAFYPPGGSRGTAQTIGYARTGKWQNSVARGGLPNEELVAGMAPMVDDLGELPITYAFNELTGKYVVAIDIFSLREMTDAELERVGRAVGKGMIADLLGDSLENAKINVAGPRDVSLIDGDEANIRKVLRAAMDETSTPTEVQPHKIRKDQIVTDGDIFDGSGIPVIPTNRRGVHGAGIANDAQKKGLVERGKGTYNASDERVVFPVKDKWDEQAQRKIIMESLLHLRKTAQENPDKTYLLPPIGLGHGGLDNTDIQDLVGQLLEQNPNIKLVLPSSEALEGQKVGKLAPKSKQGAATRMVEYLRGEATPTIPPRKGRAVNMGKKESYDVRIDRKSKWGNPYKIDKDGTREEVIEKYRQYLRTEIGEGRIDLEELASLRDKRLGCWDSPAACHGDVLLDAADWAYEKLLRDGKIKPNAPRNPQAKKPAIQKAKYRAEIRAAERKRDLSLALLEAQNSANARYIFLNKGAKKFRTGYLQDQLHLPITVPSDERARRLMIKMHGAEAFLASVPEEMRNAVAAMIRQGEAPIPPKGWFPLGKPGSLDEELSMLRPGELPTMPDPDRELRQAYTRSLDAPVNVDDEGNPVSFGEAIAGSRPGLLSTEDTYFPTDEEMLIPPEWSPAFSGFVTDRAARDTDMIIAGDPLNFEGGAEEIVKRRTVRSGPDDRGPLQGGLPVPETGAPVPEGLAIPGAGPRTDIDWTGGEVSTVSTEHFGDIPWSPPPPNMEPELIEELVRMADFRGFDSVQVGEWELITPRGEAKTLLVKNGKGTGEMNRELASAKHALIEARMKADFADAGEYRTMHGLKNMPTKPIHSLSRLIRDIAGRAPVTGDMNTHTLRTARRIKAGFMDQKYPEAVVVTDTQKGYAQLRSFLRHMGVRPTTMNKWLSRFINSEVSQRWGLLDDMIKELAEDIDHPLLRYGLNEWAGTGGTQSYFPTIAADGSIVELTGRKARTKAGTATSPGLPSHMSNEYPLPTPELYRTLTRYRRGKALPPLVKFMSAAGGSTARRQNAGQRIIRALKEADPETYANLSMEEALLLGYSHVGDGEEVGRLTQAVRALNLNKGWSWTHRWFSRSQLAGRFLTWFFRVVMFDEAARGAMFDHTTMYRHPLAWVHTELDIYKIQQLKNWNVLYTRAVNTELDAAFSLVDNVEDAVAAATNFVPGFTAYAQKNGLKLDSVARVRAELYDMMRLALTDVFPDKNWNNFSNRVNRYRKRIAKAENVLTTKYHLPLDWDFGDELEILQKGVSRRLLNHMESSYGHLRWHPGKMNRQQRKIYGRALGSTLHQFLSDSWGGIAVRELTARQNGLKGNGAVALTSSPYWRYLRREVADMASHQGAKVSSDAELAEWYLSNVLLVQAGNLFNHFGLKPDDLLALQKRRRGTVFIDGKPYDLRWNGKKDPGNLIDAVETMALNHSNHQFPAVISALFDLPQAMPRGNPIAQVADRVIEVFGEQATQLFNRRPAWINLYKQEFEYLISRGFDENTARVIARNEATRRVNYVYFNMQDVPRYVERLNRVIPFFSAMYEVAGSWGYKVPFAMSPSGWVGGAAVLNRKVDRFLQALVRSGLVEVDDEPDEDSGIFRTRQISLRVTSDLPSNVEAAKTVSGGLRAMMKFPELLVKHLTGLSSVTEGTEDPFDHMEYRVGLGNPLDPMSHGFGSALQISAGLNPIGSQLLGSVRDQSWWAGDTRTFDANGGMTFAEAADAMNVTVNELVNWNADLLKRLGLVTPLDINLHMRGVTPLDNVALIKDVALRHPNSTMIGEMLDQVFFPFDQVESGIGTLSGFTPSWLGFFMRGWGLHSAVGSVEPWYMTEEGRIMFNAPEGEGSSIGTELSNLFVNYALAPETRTFMAGEIVGALQHLEATEGLITYQFTMRAMFEEMLVEAQKAGLRAVVTSNGLEVVSSSDPRLAEVENELLGYYEEMKNYNSMIVKRATEIAAYQGLVRGLAGFLGPANPRTLYSDAARRALYYESRDAVTDAVVHKTGLAGLQLPEIEGVKDIEGFFTLANMWLEDQSGDSAQKYLSDEFPEILPFLKGKTYWINGVELDEIESYNEYVDRVRAGEYAPYDPEIAIIQQLKLANSIERETALIQEYGDDALQAFQAISYDWERYQEVQETYRLNADLIDIIDSNFFDDKYANWVSRTENNYPLPLRDHKYRVFDDALKDVELALGALEVDEFSSQTDIASAIEDLTAASFGLRNLRAAFKTSGGNWTNSPREMLVAQYFDQVLAPYFDGRAEFYRRLAASYESGEDRTRLFTERRIWENQIATTPVTVRNERGEYITVANGLQYRAGRNKDNARVYAIRDLVGNPRWNGIFDNQQLVTLWPQLADSVPTDLAMMRKYDEYDLAMNSLTKMLETGEITESERRKMRDAGTELFQNQIAAEGKTNELKYMWDSTPAERLNTAGLLETWPELKNYMGIVRQIMDTADANEVSRYGVQAKQAYAVLLQDMKDRWNNDPIWHARFNDFAAVLGYEQLFLDEFFYEIFVGIANGEL